MGMVLIYKVCPRETIIENLYGKGNLFSDSWLLLLMSLGSQGLGFVWVAFLWSASASALGPIPETPVEPVSETLHGMFIETAVKSLNQAAYATSGCPKNDITL
jgi:hypothetical protein